LSARQLTGIITGDEFRDRRDNSEPPASATLPTGFDEFNDSTPGRIDAEEDTEFYAWNRTEERFMYVTPREGDVSGFAEVDGPENKYYISADAFSKNPHEINILGKEQEQADLLEPYFPPDRFEKKRLDSTDDFAPGQEIYVDQVGNRPQKTAVVQEVNGDDDEIVVLIGNQTIETRIDISELDLGDDSQTRPIAVQRDKSIRELEVGDKAIFNPDSDSQVYNDATALNLDRPIYGEITETYEPTKFGRDNFSYEIEDVYERGRGSGNLEEQPTYIVSGEAFDNNYVGTRNENRGQWGEEVDLGKPQTPENIGEQAFEKNPPRSLTQRVIEQRLSVGSSSDKDFVIQDSEGQRYLAYLKPQRRTANDEPYAFVAGSNDEGEEIRFEFDNKSEINNGFEDSSWSVEGVSEHLNTWSELEEEDQLFVDLDDTLSSIEPNINRFTIETTLNDNTPTTRVKVDSVSENSVTVRPSGAKKEVRNQITLRPRAIEGLREDNEAAWIAKNRGVGDLVEFEDNDGELVTGVIEDKDPRKQVKNYNPSTFRVFSESEDRSYTVTPFDFKSTTKRPEFTNRSVPPTLDTPDGYTDEVDFGERNEEGAEYFAWDKQRDEFITVVNTNFGQYKEVDGPENKLYKPAKARNSEHLFQIDVLGKETDEETTITSDYNLEVNEVRQNADPTTRSLITQEWHDFFDETDDQDIKDEIRNPTVTDEETREVMASYLQIKLDEKIPVVDRTRVLDSTNKRPSQLALFRDDPGEPRASDEDKDTIQQQFDNAIERMDTVTAALVMTDLTDIKVSDKDTNVSGAYNGDRKHIKLNIGAIRKKTEFNEDIDQSAKASIIHELGHAAHAALGIGINQDNYKENEKLMDEADNPDDVDFKMRITRDTTTQNSSRKLGQLQEAWDVMTENKKERLVQGYMLRHGVEMLAVSHEEWLQDGPEHDLKSDNPLMYLWWEEHENRRQRISSEENEFAKLEPGAEMISKREGSDTYSEASTVKDIDTDTRTVEFDDGGILPFDAFEEVFEWQALLP
jgi:hypothetical protein